MEDVYLIMCAFTDIEGDQFSSVIGYASSPEKAAKLAAKHYGDEFTLEDFLVGYGSYQYHPEPDVFYSIYPEQIDMLTDDEERRVGLKQRLQSDRAPRS